MRRDMPVRRLSRSGVEQFRAYLERVRKGAMDSPPFDLLEAGGISSPVEGAAAVTGRSFETRLAFAGYMDGALSGVEEDALESDVGLWSWLSLFYFDQVCPAASDGSRRPGRDYRHILEPGYPNGHRHLLAGAYLVYTVYGLGETASRLLLGTRLHEESGFHHELAARQGLITNPGIMDAARILYLNSDTGRPRKGYLDRKGRPGSLYRFIDVLHQLDLNYDLYSLSGEEILALLPSEFAQEKKRPATPS